MTGALTISAREPREPEALPLTISDYIFQGSLVIRGWSIDIGVVTLGSTNPRVAWQCCGSSLLIRIAGA